MKINETIRKKRKHQGLTQEQVAEYLNITAPAVNKWEKGSSYPDITILPALARVLKIDLNELLAFNEDLTDIEIYNFTNELDTIAREKGYPEAFEIAMEKISEYPTCEKLIASVAPYLDGAVHMYGMSECEQYKCKIEGLYKRIQKSEVPQIRELAISMLIARSIEKENFEVAEELVNSLHPTTIDRDKHLAILYSKQGKSEESVKIWQRKILKSVAEIQAAIMCLMEIAIEDNRPENAEFLSDQYYSFTKQFSPVNWMAYSAYLELSVKRKDSEGCINALKKMLPEMKETKNLSNYQLYDHISKEIPETFTERFSTIFERELQTSEEFEFIRGNKEFEEITNIPAHDCSFE